MEKDDNMMGNKASSIIYWVRAHLAMFSLATVTLLASACVLIANTHEASQPSYQIRTDGERYQDKTLTATLDGREFNLKLPLDDGFFPFQVSWSGDFDGDGFTDAIVEIQNGGNCCPSRFFLVRYLGAMFFTLANDISISSGWSGYSLIEVDGEAVIRVEDLALGVDQTSNGEWMEDYALRDGKLVQIATHTNMASINANSELTSEEVRLTGGSSQLALDIDNDGLVDQILCSYWPRWGSLTCSVQLATGSSVAIPACERIGILTTRTDQWSDLACGRRTVLKYDSGEYRAEHD
jgi:hypothetical protein